MMLQVEDIHTYYGLVHMLHGVFPQGGGRGVCWPSGSQWGGKIHHDQKHHGAGTTPAWQGAV